MAAGAGASWQQGVQRATDLPAGRRDCVAGCTLYRVERSALRAARRRRRKQKAAPRLA